MLSIKKGSNKMPLGIYSKIKRNYTNGGMMQVLGRGGIKVSYLLYHTNRAYWFRRDLEEVIGNVSIKDDFDVYFNDPNETIRYIKDYGYFYQMEINVGLPEGHLYTSLKYKGKIIGYNKTGYRRVYVQDFKREFRFPGNVAYTYDTFIELEYRSRNLGAFLLNEVCKSLKEQGFKSIWAHIPSWNNASISMHQKLGFKRHQQISYYWVAGVSWTTRNPVKFIQQIENSFLNGLKVM